MAVVAWDMGHNPVGRAFLLADMAARGHRAELVGPLFPAYGGKLWGPIAGASLPIRTFPASDLKTLVEGAIELARNVVCDVVHVAKPRLPSLLLGALIRHHNDCPMVLDVDDHELAFTALPEPASFEELDAVLKAQPAEIDKPYSDIWTRFCETLIAEADAITVSNVALRRRFGGILVRHGRDEAVFDPARHDRAKLRAEFGYSDADRVLLFLGTPRPHKGIFEIADALERLNDPRLALCVIGTITDRRVRDRFSGYRRARIAFHADQPWERLPELVSMADAVPILQDPKHPISQYQIPAKLSDALALDVPVIAGKVPPLEDALLHGAFRTVSGDAELDEALLQVANAPARRPGLGPGRAYFLDELSYGVNTARLSNAYAAAAQNRRSAWPALTRALQLIEHRTGIALPCTPGGGLRSPRVAKSSLPRDMVFLWKQNDSDLYGRRSDMIAKFMLESGRVRRVIHFDAPIGTEDLNLLAKVQDSGPGDQGNLVYINTIRRILRAADTPTFIRRTFLHRMGSRPETAFGLQLPARGEYPDFVRRTLRELDVQGNPLLWVCPVVFDLPQLLAAIEPGLMVADIIDDQRTFPGSSPAYTRKLAVAYEDTLRAADVVLGNCQPIREAFLELRPDIHVVPNGADVFPDLSQWAPAPELQGLPRPIAGYVGNLRDRVDLDLIEAVAERFPHVTIVLVGSAHGRPEVIERMGRWPNIRMLGVRPYAEAQRIIRGFDVALMPHLKTEQSDRMNPLKLYVYFALGVPVVTTAVANIEDIGPHVNVAQDREAFLAAVGEALQGRGRQPDAAERERIVERVGWPARVREIWDILDQSVR